MTGNILAIENDFVLVDVGLKSEGSVPIREFRDANGDINVKAGDKIEVFVERFEDKDGVVLLSLKGSCSGCPSSTATLKAGIENLLKHYVPEVREVRQVA